MGVSSKKNVIERMGTPVNGEDIEQKAGTLEMLTTDQLITHGKRTHIKLLKIIGERKEKKSVQKGLNTIQVLEKSFEEDGLTVRELMVLVSTVSLGLIYLEGVG